MKKRPLLVISSTVIGTVGVLSYVPAAIGALAPAPTQALAASSQTSTPAAPTSAVAATKTASTKSASAARTAKQKSTGSPTPKSTSHPAASTAPANAPSTPVNAPPSTPSAPSTRTIAGSTIQTQFGPIQVQITVQGTKIVNAAALQTPQGGRSSQINQQAVPYLVQQTLAAQSASIQGVSGATFTSDAWIASLQSALLKI